MDHFVRRLSGSHTFLVVTHSCVSQATYTFLGMLPLSWGGGNMFQNCICICDNGAPRWIRCFFVWQNIPCQTCITCPWGSNIGLRFCQILTFPSGASVFHEHMSTLSPVMHSNTVFSRATYGELCPTSVCLVVTHFSSQTLVEVTLYYQSYQRQHMCSWNSFVHHLSGLSVCLSVPTIKYLD